MIIFNGRWKHIISQKNSIGIPLSQRHCAFWQRWHPDMPKCAPKRQLKIHSGHINADKCYKAGTRQPIKGRYADTKTKTYS